MTDFLLKLFVKDYKNTQDVKVRERYGLLASLFGLITNFLLFVSKITIGIVLGLYSIVSDSINNLSDFGNNMLSIFGVKVAAKPADEDHPYGHQRMEYIISLIIGCVIIALGAMMIYQGAQDLVAFIRSMIQTGAPEKEDMNYTMFVVTLSILLVAIVIKLFQSYLYFSLGKKISSMQLKALGKDSRNDVIATSLVVVGLLIAWFTSYSVDCFFTIVVAGLVILSGIGIIKEAASSLLGEKPDTEMVNKITNLVKSYGDVLGIHDLSMHYYGHVIYSVIHVEVDADKDVMASHEICDKIEREAREKLHVNLTVHMDPIKVHDADTLCYKELVEAEVKKMREEGHMVDIHDFRILSASDFVNLIFDMILPKELDDEKTKTAIKERIKAATNMKFGKETHIVIDFDSATTDFLHYTNEQEKE
jgi:cation diffusion facilitator family transporter